MKLEERSCRCGCGKTWRTMATSPNHFALDVHAERSLHSDDAEKKKVAQEHFEERARRARERAVVGVMQMPKRKRPDFS